MAGINEGLRRAAQNAEELRGKILRATGGAPKAAPDLVGLRRRLLNASEQSSPETLDSLNQRILRATGQGPRPVIKRTAMGGIGAGLRSAARRAAPLAAADLGAHLIGAINNQANIPVRTIQNRGGFASSVAKDTVRNTPFLPNALAGVAAGTGAAAGSAVTGTYPSGAPAVGLHRVGAALDAFGNAYSQTEAQMNAPQPQPQTTQTGQLPAQPGGVPPDVQVLAPQTGLRGGGYMQVAGQPTSRRYFNPSDVGTRAQGVAGRAEIAAANARAQTQIQQMNNLNVNAYDLRRTLGISLPEAQRLAAGVYAHAAVQGATSHGLSPIQAANMKIELAKLGMSAMQIKQSMGLHRQMNERANIKLGSNMAQTAGKNVDALIANNPNLNPVDIRSQVAQIPGRHTPQALQNVVSHIKMNQFLVKNAYSGNTSLRLPFTSESPAPIPAGTDFMQGFVGRSSTPVTGSNNLVLKLPNSNGVLQKFQLDVNKMPSFMQTYVQDRLAALHKSNPKRFPYASWAQYPAVSMY